MGKCSACQNQGFCGWTGDENADIALIGEAPGQTEIEEGEPFVGRAGELLDKMLRGAGLYRDMLLIYNVMSCRPINHKTAKDRKPSREEINCCAQENLFPLLQKVKPRVIIAAGASALEALTYKTTITKYRGSVLEWKGIPVVPMLHPAMVLRDQYEFVPVCIRDIRVARMIAEGEWKPLEVSYQTSPNFLHNCKNFQEVACDIEGDKFPSVVGFSWEEGKAVSVNGSQSKSQIQTLLASRDITFIFHNSLYDVPRLRKWLSIPVKNFRDTMLAGWLLHSDLPVSLAFLASYHTDMGHWKGMVQDYGDGNSEVLKRYNSKDVDATFRIWQKQKGKILQYGMTRLYDEIVMPMAEVLIHYNEHGLRVDRRRFVELGNKYRGKLALQELALDRHTGGINLNSPMQVMGLIRGRGIPMPFNPSTKELSTHEDALKAAIRVHAPERNKGREYAWYGWMKEFYEMLIGYRRTTTFLSRYLDPDMIQDGRIFPQYVMHRSEEQPNVKEASQTIPSTGRLSTRNPSIQNLPKEGDIRNCILPDYDDWSLVCFDYKQIELLMALYEAGAIALLKQVCKGLDIHRYVAAKAYDTTMDQVSEYPQRWRTKRTVYGMLYGAGDEKIAHVNNIPLIEAMNIREHFFGIVPQIKQWQKTLVEKAAEQHFVANRYGRRRWFYYKNVPEILDTIPQGQAADYLHSHIVDLFKHLPLGPIQLLGEVHDEVICQAPDDKVEELVECWMAYLSTPDWGVAVAIPVDVKVGKNYGALEDLKVWREKRKQGRLF